MNRPRFHDRTADSRNFRIAPAVARKSAHLPPRGRLGGRGILAMSLGRGIFASGTPRISPHFPSKIYGNLSKNPVNLSIFIEFFGNSVSAGEAVGSAIIPESPRVRADGKCGQMRRVNPPAGRCPRQGEIDTLANAGKCAQAARRSPAPLDQAEPARSQMRGVHHSID